ncbi:MAG: hypothetical protein QME81_05200 [bacterium]|nr:hypothetical protein [bacterium]
MYVWIGVILAGGILVVVTGIVVALALGERRNLKKQKKIEERLERIGKLENVLKAYSKEKPVMAEVLREAGILAIVFCLLSAAGWTSVAEAAVRDEEIIERLARLETTVEKGFANLQMQIDNLQRQIDDVNKNLQRQIDDVRVELRWIVGILLGGMVVLISGMVSLVGFILWDRKTMLAPVVKKNEELEEKWVRLEKVIKKYALKKEPVMAELLREAGLLPAV